MKKTFINRTVMVMAAAGGLMLTSCTDHDMFNPNYKAEEYAANWEQKFGKIDPNQDWSMATAVTAKANVPGTTGKSVLNIYSVGESQKLLAAAPLTNGKGDITFDIQKGSNEVFATVFQGNKYIFSGVVGIENGVVNVTPDAKRAKTRAGESCPVTKGEVKFTHTGWEPESWDGKTYECWGAYFRIEKEGNEYFFYYSNNPAGPYKKVLPHENGYRDGSNYNYEDGTSTGIGYMPNYVTYDGNGALVPTNNPTQYKTRPSYPANFYTLANQTTSEVTWTIGDCKSLFWEAESFFLEGKDYRGDVKKALYESQGVSVADMEHGVVYTTKSEGSQISIPMMYGATERANIFGYYYYTDGQDPRAVNRYILYEDARPSSNIKVDGVAVTDMKLQQMDSQWTDNSVVTCVNRRAVYFGEDGNGTPTYDFPANVHVGFFIRRAANTNNVNDRGSQDVGEPGFAYSDPTLNEKYFATSSADENATAKQFWGYRGTSDKTVGNVKAITWEYNGKKCMGFGDDTGDCDLNDFVCWIDGDFKEDTPIKIVTKDKDTKSQSWILACEDLGDTDDYDFNDVVLEITKVDEFENTSEDGVLTDTEYLGSKIVVKCLAAGGTLPANIYYDGQPVGEAHAMLGETNTGKMINTMGSITNQPVTVKEYTVDKDWTLADNMDKFQIEVIQDEGQEGVSSIVVKAPTAGMAPQMILVPGEWKWPTERTGIAVAYPNFANWSADANSTDWVNVKFNDKLINR